MRVDKIEDGKFYLENDKEGMAISGKAGNSGSYSKIDIKKYENGGYMAKGGDVSKKRYVKSSYNSNSLIDDKNEASKYFLNDAEYMLKSYGNAKVEKVDNSLPDGVGMNYIVVIDSYKKYAKGGYVSKGELVWRKLTRSERMDFLNKNFTPQITPRSQETLVGKDYNFLPKNVKIVMDSKYANVEEYAKGGAIENQYEGRTPKDIWDNLSIEQRSHFIYDHAEQIEGLKEREFQLGEVRKAYKSNYADLDEDIKNRFENHTRQGQYAIGGRTNDYKSKFNVDDVVYNKTEKTVGIVRIEDDTYGEATTDADGNVDIDNLEHYNPLMYPHQNDFIIAPSTKKEIEERSLWKPFREEKYAKGGTVGGMSTYVSARDIEEIKLTINGDKKTLKGSDLMDGVYVKKASLKAKFDAYEVYNKLSDIVSDVWDKLKIDGGSQIYASDKLQENLSNEYEKAGIDSLFKSLTKAQRKKVAEILTDENQHSLRQYLALRGYLGDEEYNDYKRLYGEYPKNFLNPAKIKRVVTMAEGGEVFYTEKHKND